MNILAVNEEKSEKKEPDFSVKTIEPVNPTKIKVIGCGGCGGNAVNNMIDAGIQGVEFIALNTDLQHLAVSKADYKIQIGKKITGGLGAGMHPEIGEEAAKEEAENLKKLLQGTNMVFITAGMGGGTGTGSAPVVAKLAKELGILTVAVVTTPFDFEGEARRELAEEGIKKLRTEVDSLIVIPNQRVFEGPEKKPSVLQGFKIIDDILRQGVQGISDIITKTGVVNRDFNDVNTVMKGQGDAILGIGVAEGENRAVDAASMAINNKLLSDTHIDGAKNVLVKISGDESVGIDECDEIVKGITASASKDVKVLWGLYTEPELGDKISVTVVATGFNSPEVFEENQEESVAEDDVQASAKQKNDKNTIGLGDFINVLNGGSFEDVSTFSEKKKEIPVVEQSTASKIAGGAKPANTLAERRENVSNRMQSGLVPPPNFDINDINQPTYLRKKYSKLIDLSKK